VGQKFTNFFTNVIGWEKMWNMYVEKVLVVVIVEESIHQMQNG